MSNDKYLSVILNSIVRHDSFWDIIVSIQEKYFDSTNDDFYHSKVVESCIFERIISESIAEILGEITSRISSEIEDNYDELEDFDDYSDITDFILDVIDCDVRYEISDAICVRLDKHGIDYISEEDFDIDAIIIDEIDIYNIIEREYDKIRYQQNEEFKENIQKVGQDIVALFEDTSYFS